MLRSTARTTSYLARMSSTPDVALVADNALIAKPALDTRSYRLVRLRNHLQVLLIHDAAADKLAASMDVNVGAFADAQYGVPGLAHFCEHLLFMGTAKYPRENEYSQYLARHAGHLNAYTAAEHTNYYFEVDHKALEGALDRFGQFFVAPLFSRLCKDREIKAVDLENKKNLQSDMWRLYQLDKLLLNPRHPYHGFSTGNMATLGDEPALRGVDVRDTLLQFYREQYLANLMSLVVLGRQPLDELQEWCRRIFAPVPLQNLPRPHYREVIYLAPQLTKLIRARPVLDTHKVEVSFLVPQDQERNWALKPLGYYAHLLGHESKGSLCYHLKHELGWAHDLLAGGAAVCQGLALFAVEIDLTPLGMRHWRECVVHVFEYLRMVLDAGPQAWIAEEIARMSEINFRFRQKQGAALTVSKLSSQLIKFGPGGIPPHLVLSSSVIRSVESGPIAEYGQFLRLENARVTLVLQQHEVELDSREQWYGTEYAVSDLPADLRHAIGGAHPNAAFSFPRRNDFLPTDFGIHRAAAAAAAPLAHPHLVADTLKLQVWFKQDDQFGVPKGTVECMLHVPRSNVLCRLLVFAALWAALIDDELNDVAYYALLVGLSVSMHPWRDGLLVKVGGYNHKLATLVEQTIAKIIDFRPSRKRYALVRAKLAQDYKNFGLGVPYNQIGTHFLTLLNDKTYTNEQRLAELSADRWEEFVQFVETEVWSQGVFGEVLVQGNMRLQDCREIEAVFVRHLEPFACVGATSEAVDAAVKLQSFVVPRGERVRYEVALDDAANVNLCIEYYIQIGEEISAANDRLRVLTDLVCTVIHEPCFNQLRTKEQLGYVVFSGLRLLRTSFGFRVLVQLERTTDYLEYRIEEFLAQFGCYVRSLTPEAFEHFKQALSDKKLAKLKNLNEEVGRFWNAITDGHYDFGARQRHASVLGSVTLAEFQQFYADYFESEARTARVVVHLQAQHPVPQTRNKLAHAAVINHLYREGVQLASDQVDAAIEGHADFDALAREIARLAHADEPELSEPEFAAALAADIKRDVATPVPPKYPTGTKVSIEEFKRTAKRGGVPVPVAPLSEFYLREEHEEHEGHEEHESHL